MVFATGGLTRRLFTLVERSPIQTAANTTNAKIAMIAGLRQGMERVFFNHLACWLNMESTM